VSSDLVSDENLMRRLTADESRPNPYPIYARFREVPVRQIDDTSYAVSTYREIVALLHDLRMSSSPDNLPPPRPPGVAAPAFLMKDPPDHDRLRRLAMRYFGPPATPATVVESEPHIRAAVAGLLGAIGDGKRIDIVDQFAHPLPVAIICQLLGVPHQDEPQFRALSNDLVTATGAENRPNAEQLEKQFVQSQVALGAYLAELVQRHRENPENSMLSRMVNDPSDDRMTDLEIMSTGVLLLVGGHETTVNLISNGMLTLLRHPDVLARLRDQPELAPSLVEELLRFEPPVQYVSNRSAMADIKIAGTTIPKGSRVVLLNAAGNRDPRQFEEPDRFVPDRPDNQHLGYGGGIHYCFGAPLARLETQIALVELARRLRKPRLVADPPPYRPSPVLRGPIHLLVDIDGIEPDAPVL
jgi:cytochrome P450